MSLGESFFVRHCAICDQDIGKHRKLCDECQLNSLRSRQKRYRDNHYKKRESFIEGDHQFNKNGFILNVQKNIESEGHGGAKKVFNIMQKLI